jgi:tRNA A37 methylthiotransferase MiaB
MPGISLSTDIIVGFPGETEREFEETIEVIREMFWRLRKIIAGWQTEDAQKASPTPR